MVRKSAKGSSSKIFFALGYCELPETGHAFKWCTYLQETQDANKLQNASYSDQLDHLRGLEELNEAQSFIHKHNVPWDRGQYIDREETLHGRHLLSMNHTGSAAFSGLRCETQGCSSKVPQRDDTQEQHCTHSLI